MRDLTPFHEVDIRGAASSAPGAILGKELTEPHEIIVACLAEHLGLERDVRPSSSKAEAR
jgi:hypothetical protein